MNYINQALMNGLDAAAFQTGKPYPWLNPKGFLTDEGFRRLVETPPPPELFDRRFSESRKHGQQSHDRLALEYSSDLPISEAWREFISEHKGSSYRQFLARMFGRSALRVVYHWHYTPNGCSVSPHCDARRKLGSHIFYLNSDQEWRADWGGETLILDDAGRFPANSAPRFEDFDRVLPAKTMDNRSLLFMRREQSWHGVRQIRCPPDAFRRVFIVVIEDGSMTARLKRLVRGSKRPPH